MPTIDVLVAAIVTPPGTIRLLGSLMPTDGVPGAVSVSVPEPVFTSVPLPESAPA